MLFSSLTYISIARLPQSVEREVNNFSIPHLFSINLCQTLNRAEVYLKAVGPIPTSGCFLNLPFPVFS